MTSPTCAISTVKHEHRCQQLRREFSLRKGSIYSHKSYKHCTKTSYFHQSVSYGNGKLSLISIPIVPNEDDV